MAKAFWERYPKRIGVRVKNENGQHDIETDEEYELEKVEKADGEDT